MTSVVGEAGKKWLLTGNPAIIFEDNSVGRLKKRVWDASEEEIDDILKEYEIPSEPELGKAGTYIQNTPRYKVIEKRKKNDIVFVPVGCTENHGMHANSGLDTFMVTQILECAKVYCKTRTGSEPCISASQLRGTSIPSSWYARDNHNA